MRSLPHRNFLRACDGSLRRVGGKGMYAFILCPALPSICGELQSRTERWETLPDRRFCRRSRPECLWSNSHTQARPVPLVKSSPSGRAGMLVGHGRV